MTSTAIALAPVPDAIRRADLFIGALGYESRSQYIAGLYQQLHHVAAASIIFAFQDRKVICYQDNESWFRENGFEIVPFSKSVARETVLEKIRGLAQEGAESECIHVCVDISSMSRVMMAEVLLGVSQWDGAGEKISVDFLYAPASYKEPDIENPIITNAGPVLPEFAGWGDPSLPTVVILGLGYEYDRAVGTIESLDPAAAWALMPVGEDPRFEKAIFTANRQLTDLLPEGEISEYRLDHPSSLFTHLESLVNGLRKDCRPVLVPLGPKIFALVALLVGLLHRNDVTVWRVSGGQVENPVDSTPSGKVVILPVVFG